jgi:transposase
MVQVMEMQDADRVELGRLARSTVAPHRVVVQAQALLMLGDGVSVRSAAAELGTWPNTVSRWRDRYLHTGVAGVGVIAEGRGRKREVSQAVIEAIVHDTLHTVPDDGSTQWSTRAMGDRHGVGKDFVARVWKARHLRPWRVDTFKLSNDPRFEEKLVDVVGLYLNPPEQAMVLCMDEKSSVQALDHTQPSLPMKKGRAGTMTHDDKRHGTTTLFAALDVLTGKVIGQCLPRHRHTEFLKFLKTINAEVPAGLEIHLVLDNYSTHKHAKVKAWLAKHPRFHLHFTPTSSSWLNLVERWFRELTDKALRRGVFHSVPDLIAAIEAYLEANNDDPKPFVWTATAEEILVKVARGRVALEAVS